MDHTVGGESGQLDMKSGTPRRVFHLFAGERQADLGKTLLSQWQTRNLNEELVIENVDILRGGKDHNLLDNGLRT